MPLCLACLLASSCGKHYDVTFDALLDEMVSYEEAARLPAVPFTSHLESSYDRRTVSPDVPGWFANNDGFGIKRVDTIAGRVEHVLFDQAGPGVITRFWLTTMDKRGVMRFYFDGAETPQWEIPGYDLMRSGLGLGTGLLQAHPNYTPDGKGGNSLFLPIPYGTGLKITFELPDSVTPSPKYYNINFRKYPVGTRVETFSKGLVDARREKLSAIDSLLRVHPSFAGGTQVSARDVLRGDDTLSVALPDGGKAVRWLDIRVAAEPSRYEQAMRELVVVMEFDGVQTVEVPLSDFSGGGMGAPKVDSWFLSADGKGHVESRWVMPYQRNAMFRLVNLSSNPVDVSVAMRTDDWTWDERSLYFHASWRQELGIHVEANPDNAGGCVEWNFATLKGRGVYRGDVLSLFNHTLAWYGEGDEKIWIDNDTFPSHVGTGTEDYYNCSWAPVIPFYTPFGGATRADAETATGYNTFFRTRNLDPMPFYEQLRFDIEMLSWISGSVDYAATVFWYGDKDAVAEGCTPMTETRYVLPTQPDDPADYKVEAGAIEFETLKPVAKSHEMLVDGQSMLTFPHDKWSGSKQLICTQGRVGNFLEFELPCKENRTYEVVLYATKAPDYGVLEFTVNGQKVARRFDGCSAPQYDVRNSGPISLGTYAPTAEGTIHLRVELVGKNEKSRGSGNVIGLDCVVLK